MDNSAKILAVIGIIFGIYWFSTGPEVEVAWDIPEPSSELFLGAPPEVMHDPVQSRDRSGEVLRSDDYSAKVLADFSVDALVLSRRRYRNDATADVSPIDFALAWGDMALHPEIEDFEVRQRGRFYMFRYGPGQTFPSAKFIIRNSSNMHMIPANEEVRKRLMKVRKGDMVSFSGHLVEVRKPGLKPWRSSMRRTDTGNGACEIVLVRDIQIYRPSAA